MGKIKEYFKVRKLKKEIKKHDKSYIPDKYIIGIDYNTGLPIYSYPKNKKNFKKCWQIYYNVL